MKNQSQCFAHNHMTLSEYGLWTYAREVSHHSKVFQSGCRMIAARFSGVSKNTVNRMTTDFFKSGWFKEVEARKRSTGGIWIPAKYTVLSHDEWAANHPGECEKALQRILEAQQANLLPVPQMGKAESLPVPPVGQAEDHLSQNEGVPVPLQASPVPNSHSTCPITGTEIEEEKEVKKEGEGEAPPAQPLLHSETYVKRSGATLNDSAIAVHMNGATCTSDGTGFVDRGLWPTALRGKLVMAFQNHYVTAGNFQKMLKDCDSDLVEGDFEIRAIDPNGQKNIGRVRLERAPDGTWTHTFTQPFEAVQPDWFEKLARKRGN